MKTGLDHLVVACGDLEQGSRWLLAKLGVEPELGGRHVTTGTHNRLLRLGPRQYLELLAIDPDADPTAQPPSFGLGTRDVRERAAREPFLVAWVAATDDVDEGVARVPELGVVRERSRGALRYRIALPEGGSPAFDGVLPAVIQWLDGAHPCDTLEDRGCELLSIGLRHPSGADVAMALQVLEYESWDAVETGPPRIEATVRTRVGSVTI